MIRKGIVSSVSEDGSRAKVYFPDLDNVVSPSLPVNKLSDIQNIEISINDTVIVAFWGRNLSDGVIIGRVV